MKERLEPYRRTGSLDVQPHEMRGTYDECRFLAKIIKRSAIDDDVHRSTGQVTFDLKNVGLTFIPGDRLAVMPLNSWLDVEKVVGALGLIDFLDVNVPLDGAGATKWKRYARHEADAKKLDLKYEPSLTVRDILRKGKLAPLTKDMVMAVHSMVRVSSVTLQIMGSESWPVIGSLGDLLVAALNDVPTNIWDQAFPLDNLSWLPALVSPEVPRTYSISCFPFELLPETVDLTVTRAERSVSPLLLLDGQQKTRPGICSGFLNPDPTIDHTPRHQLTAGNDQSETVLIGLSRPLNFQLPVSPAAPVAMFAAGSGIAPFRGFWQARINSGVIGRNILFLGVQSRKKFLHKHELRQYVQTGKLELHVAFSRDSAGLVYDPVSRDLVEKTMEPRYIDATIMDQGPTVCDLIISTKLGGLGGYLYICGSVSLYETVMRGFRNALYKYRAVTKEGADELMAQAFAERRCILTTLSFEVDTLKKDSKLWFSDGLLSTHAIRKLYQLQSRFLTRTGFPILFGTKLQELFLSLSFFIADSDRDSLLPDVVGIITQAASSPAAVAARKEIAELGEFVTNSATSAPAFQRGIIDYTRSICELDVRFLEQIRQELCEGYDVFMRVADVIHNYPTKEKQALHKVASTLMGYLERIGERVDSFYTDMGSLSLYHPESEANPARARWKFLQRRIKDGSFFVLARDMAPFNLDKPAQPISSFESKRNKRQSVSFDHILSQAVSSVSKVNGSKKPRRVEKRSGWEPSTTRSPTIIQEEENDIPPVPVRPLRLADAHTARARGPSGSTSYEEQNVRKAAN
ncbi:hypothetical protein FRC16_004643, partial [Serendipita sp. 398]